MFPEVHGFFKIDFFFLEIASSFHSSQWQMEDSCLFWNCGVYSEQQNRDCAACSERSEESRFSQWQI